MKHGPNSIQGRFRRLTGYKQDEVCADCRHTVKLHGPRRIYYKCEMIGITGSAATDISLRDVACNLFSPGRRDDE